MSGELASWLETAERRIGRFSAALATAGAALLLAEALLVVCDIAARAATGNPIGGVEDVSSLLIPVIAASFLPLVFADRANIRATLVGERLGARKARWLDVFGHLILLAFIAVISVEFAAYAADARSQTTMMLELPTAPSLYAASAMILFGAVAQGVVTMSEIVRALRPRSGEPR
jgi:TRAP-type C4-dicarboxylate transport system permease small subunit